MSDAIMDMDEEAIILERWLNDDTPGQRVASAQLHLDTLLSDLSNPKTAWMYAGYENQLGSIKLSTELIRGAAEARWPSRAKLRVVK